MGFRWFLLSNLNWYLDWFIDSVDTIVTKWPCLSASFSQAVDEHPLSYLGYILKDVRLSNPVDVHHLRESPRRCPKLLPKSQLLNRPWFTNKSKTSLFVNTPWLIKNLLSRREGPEERYSKTQCFRNTGPKAISSQSKTLL